MTELSIRSDVKLRRKQEIRQKELGPDTLLYSPTGESLHVLNATSAFLWELMQEPQTLDGMEAAMRKQFDVRASDDVRTDVGRILVEFQEAGLLDEV